MTLTEADLAAIEERAKKARPPPWSKLASAIVAEVDGVVMCEFADDKDQDFVLHAREDVPALIAEVRRLRLFEVEHDVTLGHIAGPLPALADELGLKLGDRIAEGVPVLAERYRALKARAAQHAALEKEAADLRATVWSVFLAEGAPLGHMTGGEARKMAEKHLGRILAAEVVAREAAMLLRLLKETQEDDGRLLGDGLDSMRRLESKLADWRNAGGR